jgi:hypothetical protein
VRDYLVETNSGLNKSLHIYGNPDARKNIIPVNYVVETLLSLREHSNQAQQFYHLTNPSAITIGEGFEIICSYLGLPQPTFVPECPAAGVSKIERLFNKKVVSGYQTYMLLDDPVFMRRNTDEALIQAGRLDLIPPRIDKEIFAFLMKHHFENGANCKTI